MKPRHERVLVALLMLLAPLALIAIILKFLFLF